MKTIRMLFRTSLAAAPALAQWGYTLWRASEAYVCADVIGNIMQPLGPGWQDDPVNNGDTDRFFADLALAKVADIKILDAAGKKVFIIGLQRRPRQWNCGGDYYRRGCNVRQHDDLIRAYNPKISAQTSRIKTGPHAGAVFHDRCYTPDKASLVPVGTATGLELALRVPDFA